MRLQKAPDRAAPAADSAPPARSDDRLAQDAVSIANSRRQIERMARSGGLSLVGAGLSAVAGVALTAVITNGYDRATAGTIFATTSLFLIVATVVQLGIDVGLVRSLPALAAEKHYGSMRQVLLASLVPVFFISTAVGTAGFLVAEPLARLVAPAGEPNQLTLQIRLLAVFIPVTALYQATLAATRGLRTMMPTVAIDSLGRSGGQLLAVGAVQLAGLGAGAVVLAWSLPYALGLAVAVGWLAHLLHGRTASPPAAHPPSRRDVSVDFWRFTAPRAIGTTCQALLKRSDIVLVAALRTPAEAALYAAATRFVVVGQLAVQALQQAMSPQLSALFARDDRVAIRDVFRATTAWSMLLAWPIYISCAVLAPELLRLFGAGYSTVAPVVVVLSLAMLAATACGAVDAVLLMSGHSWLSLGNNVLALLLNLGLNVILIPAHGALGAGVAWMAAIVLRNLLPLAQIATKYRISPVGRGTVLVAASAVACFSVLPLLTRAASLPAIWTLLALGVGTLLYLALVWRLRTELQLHAFHSALRLRRQQGETRTSSPAAT